MAANVIDALWENGFSAAACGDVRKGHAIDLVVSALAAT